MAAVTLPTVTIDDSDVPRLRTALRNRLGGMGGAAAVADLTDQQLFKRWLIGQMQQVISDDERQTAQMAVVVPAPPTMT